MNYEVPDPVIRSSEVEGCPHGKTPGSCEICIERVNNGKLAEAVNDAWERVFSGGNKDEGTLEEEYLRGPLASYNDRTGEKTRAYLEQHSSDLSPEAKFLLQATIAKRESDSKLARLQEG